MNKNNVINIFSNDFLKDTDTKVYRKGEMVLSEGDDSNETMYLLLEGNLSVCKKRNNLLEEINQLKQGDFFGEIALISSQPRTATVIVVSDSAKLILISKKKFVQHTKNNPPLMFSILKATMARYIRAEAIMDKLITRHNKFKLDFLVKINQNRIKILNQFALEYIKTLRSANFKKGDYLFKEGAESKSTMFYILEGSVDLLKFYNNSNLKISELATGDFLSETSIISDKPYTQSAQVKSEKATVIAVDKSAFMHIVHLSPEFLYTQLKNIIIKLINIEKVTTFLKSQIAKFKPSNDIKLYKKDDIILKEGDKSNEIMYFILGGEYSVIKNRNGLLEEVNTLKTGDFFGELSLISNEPRTATIMVKSESAKLILFSKSKFIEQTKSSPSLMFSILKATIARLYRAETSLDKSIRRFPDLDPELSLKLKASRVENINVFNYVHNLMLPFLIKGDHVYSDGESPNGTMYFLLSGKMAVVKKFGSKDYILTYIEPGDFFGEMAIVGDAPRNRTILVKSDKAKIAPIDRNLFMKIVHISPEFLFGLLRTVIWKLIITERAINKLNIEFDLYEKKYLRK